MSTTDKRIVQPYLFFDGRCEEAIEFYRQALGAEVEMLMRFEHDWSKYQSRCPRPALSFVVETNNEQQTTNDYEYTN